MSKEIRGNQKHLSLDNRIFIEQSLSNNKSFKEISRYIGKDPSTISKEVKKHRIVKNPTNFVNSNHCSIAQHCTEVNVCKMRLSCGRFCRNCPSCNSKCPKFVPKTCPTNSRAPFVCNGCSSKQGCRLIKYYYRANLAHKNYKTTLVTSREGINLTKPKFNELDELVSPLIQKGQPLAHIFANHEDDILCCRRTLYNYLDKNILTARNLDLPRRVRFKPRRHPIKPAKREFSWLEGRSHNDFIKYISSCPDTSVVEMDTVEGVKGGKVLLTLFFRQSNLMLAYLLKQKTQDEVLRTFNSIETTLGTDNFKKTFPLILTDNGSEFLNPMILENGINGLPRTSIYYCDPRASYQKGAIEKNHEYIRYFLPQGTSFDNYTQESIALMMNHINSTARDGLNGHSPFELASLLLDESVLNSLQLEQIPPDKVVLKPYLLKPYKALVKNHST